VSRLKSWMQHELVKKTTRNSGILLSGNMGTAVFGVISTTIMARALGADLLGRLLFVQWYGVIIDKILNFQSWHVVIKFGAEQHAKPGHGEFGSVLKTGFLIDITTAVLGAITAILMIPLAARWLEWDHEMTNAAYLFGAAILFHVSGTPVGVLRILRKFGIYIRQTMLGSALKSVLVLLVWLNDGSFIHYAIALVAAESLRHLLLFASAIRVAHGNGYRVFSAPWFSDWKSFLGFAVWTNLKASILLPVQEFDKLIIARLVSYEGLAVYRVFGQLTQFASKVSTPVNQAVYPEIADLVSEGKGRDAAKLAGKSASCWAPPWESRPSWSRSHLPGGLTGSMAPLSRLSG
jgi:O-antigen/teichoic acid export membrane protein